MFVECWKECECSVTMQKKSCNDFDEHTPSIALWSIAWLVGIDRIQGIHGRLDEADAEVVDVVKLKPIFTKWSVGYKLPRCVIDSR